VNIESGILDSDNNLREIVRRLADAYQPAKIYLFGSKARGDSTLDSDYDLLVVVTEAVRSEQRRSGLAYRELWSIGAAVDVLVCTTDDFNSRIQVAASLPSTILREGKLLYAA
jgi:predicted nucleotidyltransferase